jgi:hypothetical protein
MNYLEMINSSTCYDSEIILKTDNYTLFKVKDIYIIQSNF